MCSVEAAAFEAASWESQAVAELHLLNASWVRAFADSDAAWYSEHLHDGFVCTLADGHRIDKREFLRRARRRRRAARIGCDEVDVRVLDDVALVHGVVHHRSEGTLSLTRYITVWQSRRARWRAIAAQFTPVRDPVRADIDHPCSARWLRLRFGRRRR
jgi:ketosteroid isomerase-like protein